MEYWQKPDELAHYARACVDILFKFPFSKRDEKGELMGEELEGIAARSDFDLSQHERFSGKPMSVFDEELRVAWGKLDDAKKKELSDRYYEARYKYLTKTGVPPEQGREGRQGRCRRSGQGPVHPARHRAVRRCGPLDPRADLPTPITKSKSPMKRARLETRVVMKFHPRIAPIKVGVFPLLKNKPELVKKALRSPRLAASAHDGVLR